MDERLISDDLERELVLTFGDEAGEFVEKLLRSEITKRRIQQALFSSGDATKLVADALSRDLGFLTES